MRTKSKVIKQSLATDLDEVKRRFIRQNRELAKNNSTQSLKIRGLELDVSKLLSENLELRNQVLQLQNELFTTHSQASTAAVQKVKQELQAKIAELNDIVEGIEDVQETPENPARQRKPLEGNWRERQPLSELMRDSQLPTIAEDKLFPRRTLGTDDIKAIRLSDQSSNESPDLGPPPVARFDYEDPVKNASPLVNKFSNGSEAMTDDSEDMPASLSMNLETRRKRKDGQPKLQIRRHSLLPQSPVKGENEASTIMRTGAKRKLADRETEKAMRPPSQSDFTFSRRAVVDEAKVSSDPNRSAAEKLPSAEERGEQDSVAPSKSVRKVLGDKSVNMSPKKAAPTADKPEKEKSDKPNPPRNSIGKEEGSTRRRRLSSIPVPAPQDDEVEIISSVELAPPPSISTAELPPQTPADADFFSPTPSEPSTLREPGRGDTPPPGDLSSLSTLSTSTDGGAGARPSRRARGGAVNYAEPSLISKMRRPDKKMVDAISGLQDHRRVMSASSEKDRRSTITIKKEPVEEENSAWKNLPPPSSHNIGPGTSSPLTHKSGSDDLPSSPPPPQDIAQNPAPSNSSATISALMAAGRKKRRESNSQNLESQPLGLDIDVDAAAKKLQELDIYEFKEGSSPLASSSDSGRMPLPSQQLAKSKSARRHSSVGRGFGGVGDGLGSETARPPSGVRGEGRSERAASRRRSMQL